MSSPEAPDPLELDAATMRALGHAVVDRLVERIAGLDAQPAWRGATRAAMRAALDGPPPEAPEDPAALIEALLERALPFASRVDHPRFFGYVPGSPTWPGILGDLLATGYNVFAGTWQASAGPSQIELTVLDWFRDWIGFPADAAGLLTSGGSAANLNGIVCAREARVGSRSDGAVIYCTAETHSSVARAARIAGFDAEQVRAVAMDAGFRLDLAALRAALDEDARAGRRPFLVVANAGTTSTGAVDPLDALAELCRESGLWLHVDAAYGGFAVLSERARPLLRGLERADSVVLDPHKWLYQPFEVGCLFVREGPLLRRAFQVLPDYLQDTAVAGEEVNFADRGLQLTRVARGLKVWLSVRTFGLGAFRAAIDRALALGDYAAELVARAASLEPLTEPQLGIVCFRRRPERATDESELERVNAALVQALRESGLGLISSTRVRGRYALRICAMGHRSTRRDVERVIEFLATSPV